MKSFFKSNLIFLLGIFIKFKIPVSFSDVFVLLFDIFSVVLRTCRVYID